jgi:hypothetical protein
MPIKIDPIKQYNIPILKNPVFLPPKKTSTHSEDACADGYEEFLESLKFNIKKFNAIKESFNNFSYKVVTGALFSAIVSPGLDYYLGKPLDLHGSLGMCLMALGFHIGRNPMSLTNKYEIEDYLDGLENILKNCHNGLTQDQKMSIRRRINGVKHNLELSYAAYLRQQKLEALGKLKALNILPVKSKPSSKKLMTELQKQQETDSIMTGQSRDIFIKKWIPKELINWGQLPVTAVGALMPIARPVRVR